MSLISGRKKVACYALYKQIDIKYNLMLRYSLGVFNPSYT
jgi:hypothetical protein